MLPAQLASRWIWILLMVPILATGAGAGRVELDRGRLEDILNAVAKDVERNFYDAALKGLDWRKLTEESRQQIRKADNLGDMVAAISSLLARLRDSHTYFIPPSRTNKVNYGFKAKAFGNKILVYEITKDGPAMKAGLHLGDRIVGVNGFAAERDSFRFMMFYFSVLAPLKAMQVTLAADDKKERTLEIPAKIDMGFTHLDFFLVYNEWRREMDARKVKLEHTEHENGIEYIRIPTFNVEAGRLSGLAKKVRDARVVVLDLRDNPGGRRDALVHFAGFFTPNELEMAKQISRKETEPLKIKRKGFVVPGRIVVLIDSASASASEMLAYYLQKNRKAVVIGDRSSGSVNAAQIFPGSIGVYDRVPFAVAVTVARLVMWDGRQLEKTGVTPDEYCIPSAEDLRAERDPCLEKALAIARSESGAN